MRLEAVGEVVKAGVKGEDAGVKAGDIVDLIGDGIPLAVDLFRRCFPRRFDGVSFYDERIQVDHLGV